MTSVWIRDAGVSRLIASHVSLMLAIIAITPSETVGIEPRWMFKSTTYYPDSEDFSAVLSSQSPDYAPYMESVNKPLQETDLENVLDLNDRELAKKFDFDPTHLLTLMIEKAAAQNTTPKKFYEEIEDMMTLQNRSKTVPKENFDSLTNGPKKSYGTSTVNYDRVPTSRPPAGRRLLDPNGFIKPQTERGPISSESETAEASELTTEPTTPLSSPTTLEESYEESWETTLKHLERKYNVSSECHGPDSITPFRLTLMFPHYLNLGQKPFVTPAYVNVQREATFFTTTTTEYYNRRSYSRRRDYESNDNSDQTPTTIREVQLPSFFKRQEFAGLIPRPENSLGTNARNTLIALHLYSMYRDEDEKSSPIPFRTKCLLVKWRMEKSLLSDDRRIRLLQNNNVITEDGQLTSEIWKVYGDLVPSEFYSKIFWKVFKQ